MPNTSDTRRFTSFSLALTLLALLSACSGESSPNNEGSGASGGSGGAGGGSSTTSDLPDPCTLATPAELGPIVGVTLVREGLIRGLTGAPNCTWYDADDNGVFQLAIWEDSIPYDFSKEDADSVPLSGIGVEAHLGNLYTVHVLTETGAFFTQALDPVADGQLSPEIQSAISPAMMPDLLQYEAAFRFAQLVVDDL